MSGSQFHEDGNEDVEDNWALPIISMRVTPSRYDDLFICNCQSRLIKYQILHQLQHDDL